MSKVAQDCLARLHQPSSRAQILRAVHRRYPSMCLSQIEDALHAASAELLRTETALEAAVANGGDPEARRLLVMATWRKVFRSTQRAAFQRELSVGERELTAPTYGTPEDLLIAQRIASALPALIGRAVEGFGGRRPRALRAALEERLQRGGTDTEIAERHGVRRETLSRAKSWLLNELAVTQQSAAAASLRRKAGRRRSRTRRGCR